MKPIERKKLGGEKIKPIFLRNTLQTKNRTCYVVLFTPTESRISYSIIDSTAQNVELIGNDPVIAALHIKSTTTCTSSSRGLTPFSAKR